MKKILLSLALVGAFGMTAQTTIFEDSFEFYPDFAIANVGEWTLVDVDMSTTYGFNGITFPNSGAAKAFQVFNSTLTTPPITPTATSNWTARTGMKHMVAFASTTPDNNDWLISPQIQLGTAGNTVTFWAKSCDATYGAERFKVGVSTTGTAPADFTIVSPAPYVTTPANATWVEYTYNIDNYQGQNVYIGINCVSNDQFGFAVDDFKVSATTLSTDTFFKSNFAMYPNPAQNVLNISGNAGLTMTDVIITDLNGRVVKQQNLGGVGSSEVNVSDLTSGMYFITISSAEGNGTSKFMKN